MKLFFVSIILLVFALNGCTEKQQEGWKKRAEKLTGEKETAGTTVSDTLNPDNFRLSARARRFIDLQTAVVKRQKIAHVIEMPAVMLPHPNYSSTIKSPLSGRIVRLLASFGSAVKKDSVVAVIENPQNMNQRLFLSAPISGVVSAQYVSKNEWVEDGEALLSIVNYTVLQAVIRIYPEAQEKVHIGDKVEFSGNGWSAKGRIDFISPTADPETGTISARADIGNPRGKIKTEMLLTAAVIVGEKQAVVIPHSALVPEEDHYIVFVWEQGRFEKRIVETGIHQGDLVEIPAGLQEGETIVTQGAYQLKNITFSSGAAVEEEE
jgi:multidrug efflux pump subunit AcrA (membrane-fusion protein)